MRYVHDRYVCPDPEGDWIELLRSELGVDLSPQTPALDREAGCPRCGYDLDDEGYCSTCGATATDPRPDAR